MGSVLPIQVRGLAKNYGNFQAVKGIDFEVDSGEVFGLLGPNGAGKTTTVEILEGLRERNGGDVLIMGLDPGAESMMIKDRIGVCLQDTNLPDKMKVTEAMELFASLYSKHSATDDLLKRLLLWEKRNSYYSTLSGGQKQRLAMALALVNDPQVLFLDEPTTGLDPQARLEIHTLIQSLRDQQRTILLTTHYIEEAEKLCDRVAIIDEGKIIALGTPQEIQSRTLGQSVIEIRCERALPAGSLPQWTDAESVQINPERNLLTVISKHPARTLVDMVKWIDQQGIELSDVHLKRPSLEDVFIELTGRKLRE
ncbi:MAG TPA: ABC transporter ATP-binding protein [Acidobacteriota bacterium]|nr:ABC transporter ATP-binding protein [Acidobacteriota bacterium]